MTTETPTGYKTTTDHAAEIRDTLKREHGWTNRQVSVRAMGSAITVTVKDSAIPLPIVKAIAERAEHIDRDQFGEILGGGNRFVHVSYDSATQTIIARRYADAVQRAVNAIESGSNIFVPVEGTPFLVGRPDAYGITLWDDNRQISQRGSVEHIAAAIGNAMVAREGTTNA